mgnify:CR=1 FL=1
MCGIAGLFDTRGKRDFDRALMQRFGLFGPPGIMFFDPSGREIKSVRVVGFQEAAVFLKNLQRASSAGSMTPRCSRLAGALILPRRN